MFWVFVHQACGTLAPPPRIEPAPPALEGKVLTTGLPGKSHPPFYKDPYARRYNQSILKEISLGCSLEGMMLKLKLQYFGHLVWRVDSLEKTLMLGGIGGRRRRGRQRMRWLDEWTLGVGDGQGGLVCCHSWGLKESDTIERLNWTDWCLHAGPGLISGINFPSQNL